MFKRRTSRVSHRRQVIELQAHVMSPRIAWFGLLKSFRKLAKTALVLGLIAGAVWGAKLGIRRGLIENKEFRLQAIELTPNPAVDEHRLVEVAGINLAGSLFECDVATIESRLRALPEVAAATVHREFPGTLKVEIAARQPHAWIASATHDIPPRDPARGLLVDDAGFAFHCPPRLRESAADLPVYHLGQGGEAPAAGKTVRHPEFDRLAALHHIARRELPEADRWIDSLRQNRRWSLELVGRDGTAARFGLGGHERQIADLKAALEHARSRDQRIASIELIPERNLPVVLRGDSAPRAILVDEPAAAPATPDRRARDLETLIHR
jgi:hypothetical protein